MKDSIIDLNSMGDLGGEEQLYLIRIQRRGVAKPPILMPGLVTVLTVCSGVESAKAYVAEERAAGPCRVWIAYLGDISASRFTEQTI